MRRTGGLRVGLTVDRTMETFGPEYITSQSPGLAEAVGNIGLVAVDGVSVEDRPSIELPTDSFTATFLVTNAVIACTGVGRLYHRFLKLRLPNPPPRQQLSPLLERTIGCRWHLTQTM